MTLYTVNASNTARERAAAIWFGKTLVITMVTIFVSQMWRF